MSEEKPILSVRNLKTYFDVTKGIFTKKQIVKAVDDVSFDVMENETFGLVGESGCGKTTLGRTIVKIYEPESGSIEFQGKDIAKLHGKELISFRKDMQMIFQDPYASLNPRMTVGEIIKEPMIIHNIYNTDEEREQRVVELLKIVGLKPDHIRRYPAEFSGGQRQRVGIARALAVNPKFIVCDEPISALDVSIQAQVLNMLNELQDNLGLTYLFIAHDLSVVKYLSDRVVVMYLGTLVETATSEELYANPMHPYTKALLSSIPEADPDKAKANRRIPIKGEISSPINPKDCCRFASRCEFATERCFNEMPVAREMSPGHIVACHLMDEK